MVDVRYWISILHMAPILQRALVLKSPPPVWILTEVNGALWKYLLHGAYFRIRDSICLRLLGPKNAAENVTIPIVKSTTVPHSAT